jgi:pSer/pThr/pTyr-binding forkhead associated (FHA) protein
MMPMQMKFSLKVQSGPEMGKELPLEKPELTLGRDPANDLVIADPEVSRRHARLVLSGDHFSIEDLGSTNGTFLQGQQIHGLTPLNSRDLIVIGERVILLYEASPVDPDATRVVPRTVENASLPSDVAAPQIPPFTPEPAVSQAAAEPVSRPAPPPESVAGPLTPAPEPVATPRAVSQKKQGDYFEPTDSMAGQVPAQPPVAKKRSSWRSIILIVVLLILIFIVIPWIIIDITNSYCLFVPGILNAIQPGVCP